MMILHHKYRQKINRHVQNVELLAIYQNDFGRVNTIAHYRGRCCCRQFESHDVHGGRIMPLIGSSAPPLLQDQRDRRDLSSPESIQFYLDTRFEQLKIATELELWQEAFRSMDDIYGLTCMVKKMPKTSWMAVYYT